MAVVLLVDDDEVFTSGAAQLLRAHGHQVTVCDSVSSTRRALGESMPQLLLLDLILPDGNGLSMLEELGADRPQRVVFITGHPSMKSAIQQLSGPGVSYLTKPTEPVEFIRLANELDEQREEDDVNMHFGTMVGESPNIRKVYKQIDKIAPSDGIALILGESGTGKELAASAIHRRSGRPGKFVTVNCGGFSENLIASELFGHEKGSFTGASKRHTGFFERAEGGTLFLDEITEMPIDMQTHLLRVIETNTVLRVGGEQPVTVKTRLVAATNRDPADAVVEGLLREDLYFRLAMFPITLPPLRERRGDIALLVEHIVGELNEQYATNRFFSPSALERFQAYDWPGNVRELKHTVHRAFILASEDSVELEAPPRFEHLFPGTKEGGLRVGRSISEVEKELILSTLSHYDGDKKAAADTLGISLKTLYNRLNEYADDG